ncbi:Thioredoxin [Ruminococcaceae bacterium KH2T8]|nr:Thioredoxin [Ruminococcaceae bacterium KH2T8]
MRKILISILLTIAIAFNVAGCSKEKAPSTDYRDYLGKVDYSAPVCALVYEQIPGEEEGFYGIQYKEVTDPEGMLTYSTGTTMCLYFYNSLQSDSEGVTAGVEDLAQTLDGQIVFIAVDGIFEELIGATYAVEAYPEFVLLRPGMAPEKFEGHLKEEWTMDDVAQWIESFGYTPDYGKLA